ncbi:MAG: L-threonylcarbamoyladenylate synthase [Flavobacteriia bacterium]|jgi:L-threonylcarbamoyladenylate synthase
MAEIGKDIRKAAELLEKGEVIGFPTETVYGLAGNALNSSAVEKIFSVKNRPKYNPLILHADSIDKILNYVKEAPPISKKLMDAFWPGPLTLLLPKAENVPDLVTAGNPILAIRIPAHSIARALLSRLDFPLAAPSANPFGYISPTTSAHVDKQIGSKIPYILEGGNCMEGIESTIIGFEGEKAIIFRLGAISVEEVARVLPDVEVKVLSATHPIAPGMLPYHYSPKTPMVLTDNVQGSIELFSGKQVGIIVHSQDNWFAGNSIVEHLTKTDDLKEAARNLYAAMQNLDSRELDVIITERFPDKEIGRTLNDRLEKAANKYK